MDTVSSDSLKTTISADKAKMVNPIEFQPVQSPGNYEGEFAVKDKDILFHFWPWGYHAADKRETAHPRFKKEFRAALVASMNEVFTAHRVEIDEDPDMGAIFVRANGFGESQFYYKLSVEVCEAIHKRLEV